MPIIAGFGMSIHTKSRRTIIRSGRCGLSQSGGKDSASEGKAKENSAGFSFALPSAAYLIER